MAVGYNPVTPSDGLVFNVNTANPRSYSGGTVWRDLSRYGNNGALINGPTLNTGVGGGISFDGSNDYVDCGGWQIPLAGLKNVSYSAWVYGTNSQMPIARYNNASALGVNRRIDAFYITNYTAPGQVSLFFFKGTNASDYIEIYSTESVLANQWNHVAASMFINGTNSQCKIWINNKIATNNITYSGSPPTQYETNVTSGFYTINSYVGFNGVRQYYSGQVDDVRLYNRALSGDEIAQIFNATRRRFGI